MKSKYYLSLFFIVLFTSTSHAQKITDQGNQWNWSRVFTSNRQTKIQKIEGDTIIDNKAYVKVYQTEDTINQTWAFYGAMREDSTGQVWTKRWNQPEEILAFDFNLTEGDSFYIAEYPNCSIPVLGVDSVTLLNGEKRKRIHLRIDDSHLLDYYDVYWIEGIGSYEGEIFSHQTPYCGVTDYWNYFQCFFHEDELLISGFYGMNGCYTEAPIAVREIDEYNQIKIFPNPVSTQLTIDYPDNSPISSITIYNTLGKKIKTIPFSIEVKNIDMENFDKGIYLLLIEMENGDMFAKRIIKT